MSTMQTEHNPAPIRYSAAFILRLCHNMTQKQAADLANITQADICEMEKYKPYGRLTKYIRLAEVYKVPVEALVKNDLCAIPPNTMKLPEWEYTPAPDSPGGQLGRQGEDFALQMEQERLQEVWPSLSELVFPYYKTRYLSPGFDILSLDDYGRPFALEVKTSLNDSNNFWLSPNELEAAKELAAENIPYVIRLITNWGTASQEIRDIPFSSLPESHKIIPQSYRVVSQKKQEGIISGLTHWRLQRELKQFQLAEMLGLTPHELCLYENGNRQASVNFYIKASEVLEVTIDQLIEDYEQ